MLMGTPATAGREGGDLEELHRRIAELEARLTQAREPAAANVRHASRKVRD